MLIVKKLKKEQQDFEWYPTTEEILAEVKQDLLGLVEDHDDEGHSSSLYGTESPSILDIGAGDGRALKALGFPKSDLFAIEKSHLLQSQIPLDVSILGSDFHEQTLVDKNVSVIFCNPPYSEFEAWVERIILEARAAFAYFVIPKRYAKSAKIQTALKLRGIDEPKYTKVVGEFDFYNAERKARAEVVAWRVRFGSVRYDNTCDLRVDPFTLWVKSNLTQDQVAEDLEAELGLKERIKAQADKALVTGGDLAVTLVETYNLELAEAIEVYKSILAIPRKYVHELDINVGGIIRRLETKIKNLKAIFWDNLFSHLDTVVSRLTNNTRTALMQRLHGQGMIDFTESNIRAVLVWIVRQCNSFLDDQIVETVERLIGFGNVKLYKSNQKTFVKDDWAYGRKPEIGKFTLEPRVILQYCGGFYEYGNYHGLNKNAFELIQDFITVGRNFGFHMPDETPRKIKQWTSKAVVFNYLDGGKEYPFMTVRVFQNGNMHVKFNSRFMLRLNMEFARLKGWVKHKEEAEEEFQTSISAEDWAATPFKLSKTQKLLN
jgi:hypothetical protein